MIIYFKFLFLINAASVAAVIDASTLAGVLNGPELHGEQLLSRYWASTVSTGSQRRVHLLLLD